MLAVDIQKIRTDLAQLADGNGPSIGTARVFAVSSNLPLQKKVSILVWRRTGLHKSRKICWNSRELRADKCLIRPGTDDFPGGAPSQHGTHGVNNDRLTGASFTRQGIEARQKPNVRLLNNGDIFNVKQFQHLHLLLLASIEANSGMRTAHQSISLISSQNSAAESVSRITKKAVSSPAREPTRKLNSMLSSAAQAALARPGMVLMTTMFWA